MKDREKYSRKIGSETEGLVYLILKALMFFLNSKDTRLKVPFWSKCKDANLVLITVTMLTWNDEEQWNHVKFKKKKKKVNHGMEKYTMLTTEM